jgi:hypothetical protein
MNTGMHKRGLNHGHFVNSANTLGAPSFAFFAKGGKAANPSPSNPPSDPLQRITFPWRTIKKGKF